MDSTEDSQKLWALGQETANSFQYFAHRTQVEILPKYHDMAIGEIRFLGNTVVKNGVTMGEDGMFIQRVK